MRKMRSTKGTLQGYVVSNSTPKYWSMKFFFAEAEAAPLSESVYILKDKKQKWIMLFVLN